MSSHGLGLRRHVAAPAGGAAIGLLLGGLFAGLWSITAPFWIAAVVMAAIAGFAWRPLREANELSPREAG
ncbi:hypothetical protein [Actinoplanes sp. NPDC051494]|uniref:hypothetical protein n=1 Tax=Actinoplanes sp. NPDC051494 TaxID=3363907 RepID=UPI0037A272B6